jgi:hypothetical protein
MADLDPAAFEWSLKTTYSSADVKTMYQKDYVLLSRVAREEQFKGKTFSFGVKYARTRGRSPSFAKAQAYMGPSKGKEFIISRVRDYSLAALDGELLAACEGDDAALIDAMTTEVDAAIGALKQAMGWKIYGNGYGCIGTATNSSTTVTMTNADDVLKLEDGALMVFATTERGELVRTEPVSISTLDAEAGTFVISSDPGLTGTFYCFLYGDHEAANDTLSIYGVSAWCPSSAGSLSGTFCNVDRTGDKQKLGGIRVNANGVPIVEALVRVVTRMRKYGSQANFAVCSANNMEKVLQSLDQKVIYTSFTYGDISFEGVQIKTPNGSIELYCDTFCPDDKCYILDMRSWHLKSAGGAPRFLKNAGQQYLASATADGIEIRIGYYGQSYCDAPGWNAVAYNFG